MRRKNEGTVPDIATQTLSGTVMRDAKPVKVGWIGLWEIPDRENASILRGRTVVGDPIDRSSAPVQNGKYRLDVPWQADNWYVVAEEPGQPLTQIGPVKMALNEKKTLNIACQEGGSVTGRVNKLPAGWKGHLWAVAFTRTAIQMETRVVPNGGFCFPQLPPGEYGLKVGYDGYHDVEVPKRGTKPPVDAEEKKSDPWQRAKVVTVTAGHETSQVELALPP